MTSTPSVGGGQAASPAGPRRERAALGAWLTPGRLLSLVAVGVGAYAALVALRALRTVLVTLLVSLFLSFAMEPAVQYLGQRGWRRGAATLVVFAGMLVMTAGMIAAMVPVLIDQIGALIAAVPRSLEEANTLLARLPLPIDARLPATPQLQADIARLGREFGGELRGLALGAASNVIGIGASVFGMVFQVFTVGLVTYYLVADGPSLRRTLARPLPPGRQRELLAIWELAVSKTGGYVYGRLLIAAVCALLHAVFLLAIGVPYPLQLGLWVGVTSAFVPVIGSYLGGALVLVVAAIHQPLDALWVLIFLILYQQVENLLLAPRIQAHTMNVHPAVAFLSVAVGATLLGAIGALLALPATAIIQALLSTYIRRHELIDELEHIALPGQRRGPSQPPGRDRPRLPGPLGRTTPASTASPSAGTDR